LLACIGSILAINRDGASPAVATNIVWALFNIIMFLPFIIASCNWRALFSFRKQPVLEEMKVNV
jgi:hypothetical protein